MGKFEYNWATAEMVKLYLRNSRAQEKRKTRKAAEVAEVAAIAAIAPATAPTPVATNNNVGGNHMDESDSDDSLDDE